MQEGADANSRGGCYGNALQVTIYRVHKKVVEVLLNARADVHRRSLSQDAVAEGGHYGNRTLFLKRRFNFSHPPRLSRFSPSRYKDILRDASPRRAKTSREHDADQSMSQDWQTQCSTADLHHLLHASWYPRVTWGDEDDEPYQRQGHSGSDKKNYALQVTALKGRSSVVKLRRTEVCLGVD